MILKTEAIVLKSFDFRETSRIATFFTRDHGKVSGILKGIRTDPKKFRSTLDRFSVNEIVYYTSRNSDLHLVSQCEMRKFFKGNGDMKKTMAASYALELVQAVMPVEEKNEAVYHLLNDFADQLEEDSDVNALVHAFQIKILLESGFRPHLDACLKCRKKVEGKAYFSLKEGGLVCLRCPASEPSLHMVAPGTVSSILFIERNDWAGCRKLKMTEDVKKELKYVLNNFLVFHLGRRLKSAQYLSRH